MNASVGGWNLLVLLAEWYGYLFSYTINWDNVGLTWLFLIRNFEASSVRYYSIFVKYFPPKQLIQSNL
jgi:hypothetical protein